jgi:hypothetical protein
MKRHFLFFFFLINSLFCSFSHEAIGQSTEVVPNSNRFPAKRDKKVTILKKTNVNADTLRTLLIVSNDSSWKEIGKSLSYFKEVMTMAELQKDIIAKGLSDKVPSISDRIGLYNAYLHYKPFVILILSSEDLKTKGFRTRLSLYDPKRSEMIFRNDVRLNLMWQVYADKKVLYPLLNSLVDYLEEQK